MPENKKNKQVYVTLNNIIPQAELNCWLALSLPEWMIDGSFVRELTFESVDKILWYDHSNESLVNHELKGSWFTSFSRVLQTSQVGYHAGKPIESVVYCFYKIKGHQ